MRAPERGTSIPMLCVWVLAFLLIIFIAPLVIGLALLHGSGAHAAATDDISGGSGSPDGAVPSLPENTPPQDVKIPQLNGRGLVYVPEIARAGAPFPYFDNAALYLLKHVLAEDPMPITFAYRPRWKQEQLYAARGHNPNPVARPGTSPHESGFAVDTPARSISAGDLARKRAVFAKYGAHWAGRYEHGVLRGDPPHFAWRAVDYGYRSKDEAIRLNAAKYHAFTGQ